MKLCDIPLVLLLVIRTVDESLVEIIDAHVLWQSIGGLQRRIPWCLPCFVWLWRVVYLNFYVKIPVEFVPESPSRLFYSD